MCLTQYKTHATISTVFSYLKKGPEMMRLNWLLTGVGFVVVVLLTIIIAIWFWLTLVKPFLKRETELPNTVKGWKALFWITMRRCPRCHKGLLGNRPYDGELWCLPCGGARIPRGMMRALKENKLACDEKRAKKSAT